MWASKFDFYYILKPECIQPFAIAVKSVAKASVKYFAVKSCTLLNSIACPTPSPVAKMEVKVPMRQFTAMNLKDYVDVLTHRSLSRLCLFTQTHSLLIDTQTPCTMRRVSLSVADWLQWTEAYICQVHPPRFPTGPSPVVVCNTFVWRKAFWAVTPVATDCSCKESLLPCSLAAETVKIIVKE